ncbi:hypothetical protein ACROYT_G010797 [Oculina patagonica]
MKPEPEVEFSDTKASDAKRSSRNVKIAIIGVLTVILLLGAVVSVAVYFTLSRKASSNRLAEVNLEEGETLTYRVDQDIQIQGGDTQKGTIHAVVGIRVLNKTADEYWFLMKVNLSYVAGNVDIPGVKTMIMDYFLVRLEVVSSSQTPRSENGTGESFELFGNRTTDKEFIRFMYRILDQLLPAVKRDLYEDVDGEKSEQLNPEKSARVPGAVKMHREANTLDKGVVFIKNRFNRSDLVNFTSAIDMNMAYSDRASINKSNGMVTESHAFLSEQMNFGTPIRTKSGSDVTMMDITVFSHVTLIETDALYFAGAEVLRTQSFVRLTVSGAKNADQAFNSGHKPSCNDSAYLTQNNSTPTSSSMNGSITRHKRSISETFTKRIKLFHKEVIGIDISGGGKVWVEARVKEALEIGVEVIIKFGDFAVEVLHRTYAWEAGTNAENAVTESWNKKFTRETLVYDVILGVEFELEFKIFIDFNFPKKDGGQAIEIKPIGEVVAAITGFAEVWPAKAGARGTGTIVKVSLPLSFTYQGILNDDDASLDGICMQLRPHFTALKLTASSVYQRFRCKLHWTHFLFGFWLVPLCEWSDWEVYKKFGELDGIDISYDAFNLCF